MTIKEYDKIFKIAQEIKDFCYEYDYWDFMAYCEDQQESEYVDWDGMTEHFAQEIEKDPAYFVEYLEGWEEEKADKIAQEIKELMTAQKGEKQMKKWALTCSVDAVDIDYETVIESETEPGFWECETIAQENGCEWWMVEEIN